MLQVARDSEEFMEVESLFLKTMYNSMLRSVHRIENLELWQEFIGYAYIHSPNLSCFSAARPGIDKQLETINLKANFY